MAGTLALVHPVLRFTVATLLMAVMYFCMVYTIAELSAAPHAGGFHYPCAMGPVGGLSGATDVIEYVITQPSS